MFMAFGKKWRKKYVYLTKQFYERGHQYSMAVNNTTGPRISYSDISDARSCEIVGEVLQVMPNAGETQ